MIEWTAAAINDQIGVAREALSPPFQIGDSLLGLRGPMKYGTWNVGTHVERTKTNAHDNGFGASF